MPQNDILKRYLEAGAEFTNMTRKRAEAIVRDLVKAGEVQTAEAQQWVNDLVSQSRENTEAIVDIVRKEIADQLAALGLATRDDLERLEARLSAKGAATPAPKAPAATTVKKAPAKAAKKATKA